MKTPIASSANIYKNKRLVVNHYVVKNGKLVQADTETRYEPNNRWIPHQPSNRINPQDYFSNTVKNLQQELKSTKQELEKYQNQSLQKNCQKRTARSYSLDNQQLLNIIQQKDQQLKIKNQQLQKANEIIHCLEKKEKKMNEILQFKQKIIKQQQESIHSLIKKESSKVQKKNINEYTQTEEIRKSSLISNNKSAIKTVKQPLGSGDKNNTNIKSTQGSDSQLGENLKNFSNWAINSKRVSFISQFLQQK